MENTYWYENALQFAIARHSTQTRKGSLIPYITHPIQVANILFDMRASENIVMAGLLHDTLEDTDTTRQQLTDLFGDKVAELVAMHSEDKSLTWDERKAAEIKDAKEGIMALRMLILADKLANIHSLAISLRHEGEEMWDMFNAPKEKQSKYYGDLTDAFADLQHDRELAPFYWEFVATYKDVCVKYFTTDDKTVLYQVTSHGEAHCLSKDNPRKWVPTDSFPDEIYPVSRTLAERLEDTWCDISYAKSILNTVQ